MKHYTVFTVCFTFVVFLTSADEQILFVSDRHGNDEIYRHFPGVRTQRLTFDEGGDYYPALSPDGAEMAYVPIIAGILEIAVFDFKSGKRNQLTFSLPSKSNHHPTWSPDGSQIAFSSDIDGEYFDIYIMDVDGKNLTNMTDTLHRDEVSPDWSPVSQKILFSTRRRFGTEDGVYLLDVITRNQRKLATVSSFAAYPKWSPKGSRIAYLATEWRDLAMLLENAPIWRMKADGTNLEVLVTTGKAHLQPSYSPDGKRIVFASDRGFNIDIYTLNLESLALTRLTTHVAYDSYPDWSPDGEQIAFMSIRDGNPDIFTMTINRAQVSKLTNSAMAERRPKWSHDGEKIAFIRIMADESTRIFVMDSSGENEIALVDLPFSNDYPAWSWGGDKIAFVNRPGQGDSKSRICTVDSDGQNLQVIYEDPDAWIGEIAWSSDDTQIVFSHTGGLITFLDTPTLKTRTIVAPVAVVTGLDWSPDGQDIIFSGSARDKFDNFEPLHGVFVIDSGGDPIRNIPMDILPPSATNRLAWSPDGKRILLARQGGLYTLDLDTESMELLIKSASQPDWQDPSLPRSVTPQNKLNTIWGEMKTGETR